MPAGVTRVIVAVLVLALAAAAWMSREQVLDIVPVPFIPLAPHEQYTAALSLAGLSRRADALAWRAAAARALADAQPAGPIAEFVLEAQRPDDALAWRVAARRGQRVTLEMGASADTVFLDLFEREGTRRVAYARARTTRLSHVARADGELLARAQPRLGWEGTVRVTQRLEASLRFPVQGIDSRRVASAFGAPRDSGRRRHEGIDILAPRRTPVIAAADGWVTRQTSNRLGGKVVWLWAPSLGVALYYAHLDEQAVTPGERVTAGEIVGYVGNTGNARGTAPHLHFGIYAGIDGAVDPLPFVVDPVMHRTRAETQR